MAEVSTVPWRNGWAFDLLAYPLPFKQAIEDLQLAIYGISSLTALPLLPQVDLFLFLVHASLISVLVSAPLPSPPSIQFTYDTHLQDLYIMVIISSYLAIYLCCSASQSLRLHPRYLVSSRLSPPSLCLSLVTVNPWTRLVSTVSISMYDLLLLSSPCFTNPF